MRRGVVAAGIAVLVVLLGAPSAGADEVVPVRDSWPVGTTPLDDSPLGARRGAAVAIRGSRLYVVGGVETEGGGRERAKRDAAVLDLRTKKWRDLPDVPFRKTLTTGAISAGRRLVVTGVTCPGYVGGEHGCTGGRQVAAIYSPRTDEWERLRVPRRLRGRPVSSSLRPLVASRDDVVFVEPGSKTVAVDLRTRRWRVLPPQLGWTNEPVCANRRYAAFLGGAPPGQPNAVWTLAPDGKRWRGPIPYDDDGQGVNQPACSRDSVVTTTFGNQPCAAATPPPGVAAPAIPSSCLHPDGTAFGRVQRYHLATGQWSDVPPPPFGTGLGYYATGHAQYVDYLGPDGGPATRLTPATGTWAQVAPGPVFQQFPTGIFWTRGLAVIQDFDRLYVYRPV